MSGTLKIAGTTLATNPTNSKVEIDDAVSGKGICKAWVNFNAMGTVAIRASFNVSSITDNAIGDFNVNWTTAMPDANYSCQSTGGTSYNSDGNRGSLATSAVYDASTVRIITITSGDYNKNDTSFVAVAIFR